MTMFPDREAAVAAGRPSGLSAVLTVNPAETAHVIEPPARSFAMPLRPMMVLPGGLRLCVDHNAPHAAAAQWWRLLGVACVYAAMWHDHHAERDV